MKTIKSIVLAIIFSSLSFVAFNVEGAEKSTWDRYINRTFQSIIEQHREVVGGADIVTSMHDFASCVTVVYMGKHRLLTASRARFLDTFYIDKSKMRALYESEVLVREGKRQFWLPIQKELLPYLLEEVKEGQQFVVFATWLGGYKDDKEFEWVFTITAFDSLQKEK